MTSRSTCIRAAGFELHVTEWGDPASPPLVMWHGLARTGRDFDEAASALSDIYFVLCPDTIGRGLSGWAADPGDYSYATYGATAVAMLDHYGIERVRWIGTSMGGLLGMVLAAGSLKDRISHLVINDVGPEISGEGLERIVDYVGNPPVFDTLGEFEAWLRTVYAPFGENDEAFWRRMADTSMRRTDDGRVTVHYDPGIVVPLKGQTGDFDIWPVYDAIDIPALLIRGATSDVLSAETADAMTKRGPKPRLVTLDDYGHAPTLTSAREIDLLRAFLKG
ncbi:alpha/beta fold hydrolase [Aliihoeflea aestuarii]|jgi:pimeloyl-ACP methyl ester carboxylesterase|uniref:alpha/beta fold hydrolase n=1 Tax=Aliihoeflea aestuarii TaxID=453840 RepID=UPI002093C6A4|nr:alpha/beta hydrolase [Aliihoeflea aestuarii]MCO6391673.1 alpha/beta fold hydrolase [Aliihoeflea aestuarii]